MSHTIFAANHLLFNLQLLTRHAQPGQLISQRALWLALGLTLQGDSEETKPHASKRTHSQLLAADDAQGKNSRFDFRAKFTTTEMFDIPLEQASGVAADIAVENVASVRVVRCGSCQGIGPATKHGADCDGLICIRHFPLI